MHKKLLLFTILGILFTSLTGTLLHFVYEWSQENFLVGLLAPVNESTWEHMKLVFFPMLLYGLFSCAKLKNSYPCICSANALGLLLGTFAVPILFYTYSGLLGRHFLAGDIAVFLCSVVIGFLSSYAAAVRCKTGTGSFLPICLVFLLLGGFFLFTVFPPDLGIFLEPSGS